MLRLSKKFLRFCRKALRDRNTRPLAGAVLLLSILGAIQLRADPPFNGSDAFIRKSCVGCHNSPTGPGRLDLTKLGYEPSNPDNFNVWVKVHDLVSAGQMPPAGIPRPPAEAVTQFVKGLEVALTGYEQSIAKERGRAGLRRLNAYEYENAVRDLLDVPWVQIKTKLPQDGEAFRFNKIGGALDVSHVQLSRYMSSADYALREAMSAKLVQAAHNDDSHLRPSGAVASQLPAPRREHTD